MSYVGHTLVGRKIKKANVLYWEDRRRHNKKSYVGKTPIVEIKRETRKVKRK